MNELYALRAGLSLASQKMDEVRKVRNDFKGKEIDFSEKIKEKSRLIISNAASCEIIREKYISSNNDVESRRKRVQDIDFELESIKDKAEKERKRMKVLKSIRIITVVSVIAFIIFFFGSCLPITGEIIDAMEKNGQVAEIIYNVIGFTFFGISCLGGVILGILHHKDFDRCNWALKESQLKKEKEALLKALDAKIYSEEEIEKDEKLIAYIRQISDEREEISNLEAKIEKEKRMAEKEVNAYSKDGEQIYQSLIPIFDSVLDKRDWRNVDLIIFLLETGRAENMKEALQQVDMYRHTEKIARAVENASLAICSSISRGIAHLEGTIKSCALDISTHLESIQTNQTYLENQLIESNENLSRVINATNMQNALIEKASTSSEQLVKDVEQMRKYADEAYFMNYKKWYS